MGIEKIDKNLRVETEAKTDGLTWYDITNPPFEIYGLYKPSLSEKPVKFCRMDTNAAAKVSEAVAFLNRNTAGGRLRFVTDSKRIVIKFGGGQCLMPHMTLAGSAGFDLYVNEKGNYTFAKTFIPPFKSVGEEISYESSFEFADFGLRDLTINFPLYNNVEELTLGLNEGSCVLPASKYKNEKPFVFYGSSITQGGCANRPGNSYQGFLSRMLDIDYVNLGFSGSAKGERAMAEYIADLPMTAFIMDYDHNAPNPEWLEKTHYDFYKIIRDKNPDLPIICLSRPRPSDNISATYKIVEQTWLKAKAEGDQNIYFINGNEIYKGDFECDCTVDGTHPTDLGFYRMAMALKPFLEKILKNS